MNISILKGGCLLLAGLLLAPLLAAQPLRNLVSVEGIRDNQLIGYGLVVGLAGSGDGSQAKYVGQSLTNLLQQFGLKLPPGTSATAKNTAAVMVSAVFPSGYSKGQIIDVTVSSLGDAKSLRGGTLLLTPLRGADGEVYALAQGNLVVPAVTAQGNSGSSVTVNLPTAGRIPRGASIEREIATDFDSKPTVKLSLKRPNFQTATNIVNALNRQFGHIASAHDATSVEVQAPADPTQRVAFVAKLNAMNVEVGADVSKVIFNTRTGTVVVGEGVRVHPAAVSHGVLKVVISEGYNVSQPGPLSNGTTTVTPSSSIKVEQGVGRMFKWPAGVSLQTIIDTVNSTGATPDDIMAILQALDEAGAIEGELVVI
ncbi:flagellar basal body P-ring protein FlgI [Vogesella sp. LIG4]|uniref:flagellar basal body P-ring protein FlgI n=1 Tax=Vogesella sp. LIG4 TaxID=1192162 RepID=UPI00081F772B|nr:flagellar basal body P-ring protein FlgI [Vogesella sp. LIG4]SCK17640.1 flagellar P-ring protein precursor FlgI [Vogesella sp. LIG4]